MAKSSKGVRRGRFPQEDVGAWLDDPTVPVEDKRDYGTFRHLTSALQATGGDKQRAAQLAGYATSTFYREVGRLGVKVRRRKLLLLDDEPMALRAFGRSFGRHCDVVTETDPRRARAQLVGDTFDGFVCDHLLGPELGTDLYRWVARKRLRVADHFVLFTAAPAPEDAPCPVVSKIDGYELCLALLWPSMYSAQAPKR